MQLVEYLAFIFNYLQFFLRMKSFEMDYSHMIKLPRTNSMAPNFSLHNLEPNVAKVKENYSGTIVLAEDLQCIEVKKKKSDPVEPKQLLK